MIRKGPKMDVSDIKLLQAIYYILASSFSNRMHMSAYEFRTFLIAELRIDLIDEDRPLFAANNKVILFFPELREDERQVKALLLEILIPYLKTFVIAYAIQNKTGACIIRFELSDGFVSSH